MTSRLPASRNDGSKEPAMPEKPVVTVYIDFKSPYAYLAKDPARDLERRFDISLDWLPYILDIPSYLGSARLDAEGCVIEENRNAHQWRRVKYSYMDCRRQARKRGLVIRGTQKIWDSTLAAAGMLYAKRQGADVLHRYIDITFERFWKRELDIEDPAAIESVLAEAGAKTADAAFWLTGDGPREIALISRDAEEKGVFGVPTFVIDGELFWGSEHLPDIRDMLAARNLETQ
jgi:2-hydroxychromene-2-carboxylate isomerase